MSYLAGGGFLVGVAAVFPAWALGGVPLGVPAVALAIAIGVCTKTNGFIIMKALSIPFPVAAALIYKNRLLKTQNLDRRVRENLSTELAALETQAEQTVAKIEAVQRRVARTPSLRQACQALGTSLEIDEGYHVTVREVVSVLESAERAMLFMMNDKSFTLSTRAAYPALPPGRLDTCPAQEADRFVFERGKPYLCTRASGDMFQFDEGEPGPVGSFASAPIWVESSPDGTEGRRRCVGVLRVVSSKDNVFSRSDMEALNIVATLAGMSIQNAALYGRCKQLSIRDALTGLYTRHYFLERFTEELTRSAREHAPLSFLMMDIDNFKVFNDTYGHPAGDRVLQQVADVLKSENRGGDLLVRYGGEEFAAFSQTEYDHALQWAERIRAAVERAQFGVGEGSPPITISVGVGAFPTNGVEVDEIIEYADKAMYRAKEAGKNRVS